MSDKTIVLDAHVNTMTSYERQSLNRQVFVDDRDYENASDFEINKAVAEALGKFEYVSDHNFEGGSAVLCDSLRACDEYDYCNTPSDAWPIIVENEISIEKTQGTQSIGEL